VDLNRPLALLSLALLPLLWWLARPPRPRRVVQTAHLTQWRAALLRLHRRDVRFRRLRFWLLVAAYAATVLATAEPELGATPGPRILAVVVDDSASMAAEEVGGGTAFGRAIDRVRAVLANLPPGVEVRLGTLGPDREPLILRGDAEQVGAGLGDLQPGRSPLGAADLAALAASLAGDPAVAVWTLTDARGPGAVLPDEGALEVVGSADLPNRAIVRVAVDDRWPLAEVGLAVEVHTFPAAEVPPAVAIRGGIEVEAPRVEPRGPGAWRLVYRGTRTSGGPVEVALDGAGADALRSDDRGHLVLPPPARPRIGVLRAAVAADDSDWVGRAARLLAEASGGEIVEAGPGARVDLLLVDGGALPQPSARSISFGSTVGAAVPPSAPGPRLVDWDRRHPLTGGLDLSELLVRAAVPLPGLVDEGVAILDGDGAPLAVAVERAEGRSVHLGFRLEDSNLPYLAAFPQFLRRAFLWLQPERIPPRELGVIPVAEADLRRGPAAENRPLPEFSRPGAGLAAPLLLLAVLLLAVRAHLR
jgi:hypothetical protein